MKKRKFIVVGKRLAIKRRSRFEGRVKAQATTREQVEVAAHGRVLTNIERLLSAYLFLNRPESLRASLGEAILKAIDERDIQTLRILVDSVAIEPEAPRDPLRANIVAMKGTLIDCGLKMTVQELARLLELPKTDDGFSRLRRLCRDLAFPIAPDKRGRKRGRKLR